MSRERKEIERMRELEQTLKIRNGIAGKREEDDGHEREEDMV